MESDEVGMEMEAIMESDGVGMEMEAKKQGQRRCASALSALSGRLKLVFMFIGWSVFRRSIKPSDL